MQMRISRAVSPHPRIATITLFAAVIALPQAASAQDKPKQESFPPADWQKVEVKQLSRKERSLPNSAHLTASNTLKLHIERPKSLTETVITDGAGKVLARGKGDDFVLANRSIGDRYVTYFCEADKQRVMRYRESFIQYPGREFPGQEWLPREDATLELVKPKQITPRTMVESFDKPHHITFTATPTKERVIYLMTKIEAGGKEQVASQSLTGTLPFWMHAKRGESFRIYQVFPEDQTYRVTTTMTVARDYPIGK